MQPLLCNFQLFSKLDLCSDYVWPIYYNNCFLIISNIMFLDLDTPRFNQPSEVRINETDAFSVSCSSVSFPPASFKWFDANGRIVSYSSLLTFNGISRTNATSYTCAASNVVTTRSSQAVKVLVQCRLCFSTRLSLVFEFH